MSEKFNKFKDNLKAFFTAENMKKVFTVKNIIIMVVAVALIVCAICALVSANKARKEAEANADSLQGQLDDLKNQIGGKLDADDAIDADDIKDAIDGIEFPAGITAEEVANAIAEALKGISTGLTEEQIKDIVNGVLANYDGNCDHITQEELEQLIKDLIANQKPSAPAITVNVSSLSDWKNAASRENVGTIVLSESINMTEAVEFDRDVVIDLNGNSLSAPKAEYPNALGITATDNAEVVIKNGTFVAPKRNLNGGMDFFRVGDNAVLTLENVTITLNVTAEVEYNNTAKRWQSNSATHRIFVLGTGSTVNLINTNITVVSPKTSNVPDYVRYRFSIVGVHFGQNSTHSKFVMDGGSFTMQVTDPNAVKGNSDYTDSLYFIKSERDINYLTEASNSVELKGDAHIAIGAPDEAGKIQTTNNLFYLGAGYLNGKTYYSGIKTVSVGSGVEVELNGVNYSLNSDAQWDLEAKCQALGTGFANKNFDNAEEIKYHFSCSNNGYGCDYEADLTLSEVPAKCPECGKGSLGIN